MNIKCEKFKFQNIPKSLKIFDKDPFSYDFKDYLINILENRFKFKIFKKLNYLSYNFYRKKNNYMMPFLTGLRY